MAEEIEEMTEATTKRPKDLLIEKLKTYIDKRGGQNIHIRSLSKIFELPKREIKTWLMEWYPDGYSTIEYDDDKSNYWEIKFFRNDELHRDEDLPAVYDSIGNKKFFKNGELHRDGDKPASIEIDPTDSFKKYVWKKHGSTHRDGDKPAIIELDGGRKIYKYYFQDRLHREGDKPAIIHYDKNGHIHLKKWAVQNREHRDVDKPSKIVIEREAKKISYRKNDSLHRDGDKPAKITKYFRSKKDIDHIQTELKWYKNDLQHRDGDKPATIIRYGNGLKYVEWAQFGLIHRDGDKPARINEKNNTYAWHKRNHLHRDGDKPALIQYDFPKSYVWYKNGLMHRDGDKPALKEQAFSVDFYQDKEDRVIIYLSPCWRVKYLKNGNTHRDGDKPAYVDSKGQSKKWYKNDKIVREGRKPDIIGKYQVAWYNEREEEDKKSVKWKFKAEMPESIKSSWDEVHSVIRTLASPNRLTFIADLNTLTIGHSNKNLSTQFIKFIENKK